jgi:hypothetical protein
MQEAVGQAFVPRLDLAGMASEQGGMVPSEDGRPDAPVRQEINAGGDTYVAGRDIHNHLQLPAWLRRGWRVGLVAIVVVAGTTVGLVLSLDGPSTYSNRGDCNAQGSGNTVICTGTTTTAP